MKTAAVLGVLTATTLLPAIAWAQPDGDDKGTEVELAEDPEPPPEDMDGTSENPDAPKLIDDEERKIALAPAAKRTGYPIEEVLRPLTLPAVTSEVGMDVRSTFGNLDVEIGLDAEYGITRQWQIGLRYGVGGLFDADGDGGDGAKFKTGKAFGLDVTYLVFDWLAARVTLPFYVDPFAMGAVLGAPMKFRFGDKLAFVAVDDFLEIKFAKFIPSLRGEAENTALVALDATNTVSPDVNLRLGGGVIYQQSTKMAIRGEFAQRITNLGGGSAGAGVDAGGASSTTIGGSVQYSPSPRIDLIGGAAIDDLSQIGDTFGIRLAASFRI